MPNVVSQGQTMWKIEYEVRHFGSKIVSLETFCNIFLPTNDMYRHTVFRFSRTSLFRLCILWKFHFGGILDPK